MAVPPHRKLTKRETEYTPKAAHSSETCGQCVHWRAPNACHLVAGAIRQGGWCNRFLRRAGSHTRGSA